MIEVDQLIKRFGAVTAVNGLTFTVRPGHVTGFLGPNGAGKTTTMRVILGLDAPTSGTARVNQQPYQELIRPLHQVGALLDATAPVAGPVKAWWPVIWLAGLVAVIFLWQRPSTDFFKGAFREDNR